MSSSHSALLRTGAYAGWQVAVYYGNEEERVSLSAVPPFSGTGEPRLLGYTVIGVRLASGEVIGEGWDIIDAAGRGGIAELEQALAWLIARHTDHVPLCPTPRHGAMVPRAPGTEQQRWCGTWYACPQPLCRNSHLTPSAALHAFLDAQAPTADPVDIENDLESSVDEAKTG